MIILCGVELVTAADVRERWGDVAAARLRAWCQPSTRRAPLLAPITVAQLAALTGRAVPPGRDPHAPARVPGPSGDANLYDWQAVVRADKVSRGNTSGPSRRRAA